jgi:3-methyladenine DNA glycosylase AlkD
MRKAMHKLQEKIQNILKKSIDSTPELASKFFKTGVGEYAEFDKFLGIKTPALRKIAKKYRNLPLPVIKHFLNSKFNEERLFALIVLVIQYKKADSNTREDIFQFYLKNIEYVNNWNLVDNSAHHIVGAHLWDRDRSILIKLAGSKNLWERRISIVSTWYFIKQQDFEYTTHISKLLLDDREDLMHKACGWMLREVGKQNQESLINFLDLYANLMPRTMLRYSLEKFSDPLRKHYLLCK